MIIISFPQKATLTQRNISPIEKKLVGHTDEITSILVEKNILISASFDLTIRGNISFQTENNTQQFGV